jgi:hypothetical protein
MSCDNLHDMDKIKCLHDMILGIANRKYHLFEIGEYFFFGSRG